MPRAQFDLSNVTAGSVNLFGDQSRELLASVFLTFRNVAASMNAESFRRGIEIGLQHVLRYTARVGVRLAVAVACGALAYNEAGVCRSGRKRRE